MGEIYLSSDFHYGHKNMVEGCSNWNDISLCRQYDTLDMHNHDLIKRINDTVGVKDTLYHLGDWAFGGFENIKYFKDRLVCQDIRLILGNHDKSLRNNEKGCRGYFTSVDEYLEIDGPNGSRFVLFHYPIQDWHHRSKGAIQLFVHQHRGIIGPGKQMGVEIDQYGKMRTPLHIEEIIKTMNKIPIYGEVYAER